MQWITSDQRSDQPLLLSFKSQNARDLPKGNNKSKEIRITYTPNQCSSLPVPSLVFDYLRVRSAFADCSRSSKMLLCNIFHVA